MESNSDSRTCQEDKNNSNGQVKQQNLAVEGNIINLEIVSENNEPKAKVDQGMSSKEQAVIVPLLSNMSCKFGENQQPKTRPAIIEYVGQHFQSRGGIVRPVISHQMSSNEDFQQNSTPAQNLNILPKSVNLSSSNVFKCANTTIAPGVSGTTKSLPGKPNIVYLCPIGSSKFQGQSFKGPLNVTSMPTTSQLSGQLTNQNQVSGQLANPKNATIIVTTRPTTVPSQITNQQTLSSQLTHQPNTVVSQHILSSQIMNPPTIAGKLTNPPTMSGHLTNPPLISGQLTNQQVLSDQLRNQQTGQVQNQQVVIGQKTNCPAIPGKVIIQQADSGNVTDTSRPTASGQVAIQPTVIGQMSSQSAAPTKVIYVNGVIGKTTLVQPNTTQKNIPSPNVMPGTTLHYRTPGSNFRNRSGNIKRPMNAFMVWARTNRAKLSAEMPNASNAEISVRLGQVWANLNKEEKQQYYLEAERIKMRHRHEFPGWVYRPQQNQKRKPQPHNLLWERYNGNRLTGRNESITTSESCAQTQNTLLPESPQNTHDGNLNVTSQGTNTVQTQVLIPAISRHVQTISSNLNDNMTDGPTDNGQQIIATGPVVDAVSYERDTGSFAQGGTTTLIKVELPQMRTSTNTTQQSVVAIPAVVPSTHVNNTTTTNVSTADKVLQGQTKQPQVKGKSFEKLLARRGRPPSVSFRDDDYKPTVKFESKPVVSAQTPTVSSSESSEPTSSTQSQASHILIAADIKSDKLQTKKTKTTPSEGKQTDSNKKSKKRKVEWTDGDIKAKGKKKLETKLNPSSDSKNEKEPEELWPFPFPPAEQDQDACADVLFKEVSPHGGSTFRPDLVDPYDPLYYDSNYSNQSESSLQVDVNSWQQYLNDANTRTTEGAGNLNKCFHDEHEVKPIINIPKCPSDLDICPTPVASTLQRKTVDVPMQPVDCDTNASQPDIDIQKATDLRLPADCHSDNAQLEPEFCPQAVQSRRYHEVDRSDIVQSDNHNDFQSADMQCHSIGSVSDRVQSDNQNCPHIQENTNCSNFGSAFSNALNVLDGESVELDGNVNTDVAVLKSSKGDFINHSQNGPKNTPFIELSRRSVSLHNLSNDYLSSDQSNYPTCREETSQTKLPSAHSDKNASNYEFQQQSVKRSNLLDNTSSLRITDDRLADGLPRITSYYSLAFRDSDPRPLKKRTDRIMKDLMRNEITDHHNRKDNGDKEGYMKYQNWESVTKCDDTVQNVAFFENPERVVEIGSLSDVISEQRQTVEIGSLKDLITQRNQGERIETS